MGASAIIEMEDLGFTILGTTQYAYTVDGVHHQSYDVAVFQASLRRTSALEDLCLAYTALLDGRMKKVEELGEALASLYEAVNYFESGEDDPDKATLSVDSSAVTILRSYGYDASTKMSYSNISRMQSDVKYDIDTENNYIQQNATDLQNYVSKRDDAFSTVSDFVDKVAETRSDGIKNIGS